MSIYKTSRCPDCKEIAKLDTNGKLSCACKDKTWSVRKGVAGTEENRALLVSKGFTETKDRGGDVYYCGPCDRILLWLYSDGTWWSTDDDRVSQGLTLEAYLQNLAD